MLRRTLGEASSRARGRAQEASVHSNEQCWRQNMREQVSVIRTRYDETHSKIRMQIAISSGQGRDLEEGVRRVLSHGSCGLMTGI